MGIEIRNEDDGSGSEDETRDPIPKCPVSGSSVNQTHKPVGFAEVSLCFDNRNVMKNKHIPLKKQLLATETVGGGVGSGCLKSHLKGLDESHPFC